MNTFYHFIMDPRSGGPHQFVKNFINNTNRAFDNFLIMNGKIDKKFNLVFYRNIARHFYLFEIIVNFFKIFFFFKFKNKNRKVTLNIHGFYNFSPLFCSFLFDYKINWFIHEEIPKKYFFFLKIIPNKLNLFFLYNFKSIGLKKKKNFFIIKPSIDTNYCSKNYNKIIKNSFISVGNLNPTKNHLLLLEAALKIKKKIQINIAGGKLNSHKKYYEKILSLKNKCNKFSMADVTLLGKISNKLIKKHLSSSEYFIMTSFSEGTPFALLEAMSCEKICIIPKIKTLNKIFKNNYDGFYFKENNVNSLLFVLLKVLELKTKQKKIIGRNSRSIILREYSSKIFQKEVYNHFIKKIE